MPSFPMVIENRMEEKRQLENYLKQNMSLKADEKVAPNNQQPELQLGLDKLYV